MKKNCTHELVLGHRTLLERHWAKRFMKSRNTYISEVHNLFGPRATAYCF